MADMTQDSIVEKAATMMKIIHLTRLPGMDEVAIKLNCRPTEAEKQVALEWARAFRLATTDKTPWQCAVELVSLR
jgi:hypothetical protein